MIDHYEDYMRDLTPEESEFYFNNIKKYSTPIYDFTKKEIEIILSHWTFPINTKEEEKLFSKLCAIYNNRYNSFENNIED